jgi:hypothetical protein
MRPGYPCGRSFTTIEIAMKSILLGGLLLMTCPALFAQVPAYNPVYLDTSVATIRITINPDSLALMYFRDSLESDYEYRAHCTFENGALKDSIPDIGFRLRGNTSRQSLKKSFKVSFNTFVSGRSYHGIEKLNLNGEHNDPSIIRSKLAWDMFNEFGSAASRAAHVRVYINGRYYGLYISVEHVDENFVLSRYGNNTGNLYKCLWPADLTFRGTAASGYDHYMSGDRLVYELKINEDTWNYTDLADFITFLNTSSDNTFRQEIENWFNVPAFLKGLAVDAAVGSWDDYWFLKNNFYLYHNVETGRFEFIPYDYDNTFGIWWNDILQGRNWGTQDVYTWGNPGEPRPLVTRLLAIDRYKRWYSYYLNRLMTERFDPVLLNPRIDAIHTMITPAAEADSFRTLDYGYTAAQFHSSYTTALGAHVTYGLKPYISTRRTSALQQIQLLDIDPIILRQRHQLRGTDSVWVSASIEDNAPGSTVAVVASSGQGNVGTTGLFDDGLHGDGGAGDGVYAAVVPRPLSGAPMFYYVTVEDAAGHVSTDPANAPVKYHTAGLPAVAGPLVINEFMASNAATITDEYGEHDDWIEIANASGQPVRLLGKYVTDNLSNPNKWALPDTTIQPGGYLLIWADGTPAQGKFHTGYKLDKAAEQVGIFDSTASGFVALDSVTYGAQTTDVSMGRYPDLTGPWTGLTQPTPGAPNVVTSVEPLKAALPDRMRLENAYPNPFNPSTTIRFTVGPNWVEGRQEHRVRLAVYDLLGREVAVLADRILQPGEHTVRWNASGFSSGMYFVRLSAGSEILTSKVVLAK